MKIFYLAGHCKVDSPIHVLRIEHKIISTMAKEKKWIIDSHIKPSPGLEGFITKNYDLRKIDFTKMQAWENDPKMVIEIDNEISEIEKNLGISFSRCIYAERRLNRSITAKNFKHPLNILSKYSLLKSDNARLVVKRMFYFFKNILKESKPDAVVIHNYCGANSLLFAYICRHYKIPFFNPQESVIYPEKCRFNSNYYFHVNEDLIEKFNEKIKNNIAPSQKGIEFVKQNREQSQHFVRWTKSRDTKRVEALRFGNILKRLIGDAIGALKAAIKKLFLGYNPGLFYKPSFLSRAWFWFKASFNYKKNLKYFTDFSEEELRKQKYIYIPLHQDPEQQLTTEAPIWGDAVSLIEMLVKMIPLGYKLYVREHIDNIATRPKDFYEHLLKLPGVVILTPECPSTKFIKYADLILTLNGSAGWEGLLMKKPVLTLCNAYYDITGLTFKAENINEMDKAIINALKGREVDENEYYKNIALLADSADQISFDTDEGAVNDCIIRIEEIVKAKKDKGRL